MRLLFIVLLLAGCTAKKEEVTQRVTKPYAPTPHPNRLIKTKKYPKKYSEECKNEPNEAAKEGCEFDRQGRKYAKPYSPHPRRKIPNNVLGPINKHSCDIQLGAMYAGCQGELCFCGKTPTELPQTTYSEVDVFQMPSLKSKVIHTLQKADPIKKGKPYMEVIKFGEGEFIKPEFNLKFRNSKKKYAVGHRVTLLYYSGEGVYAFCEEGMDQPLYSSDFKLLTRPEVKRWMMVTLMDGRKGWVEYWPFNYQQEGCG